MCVRVYLPRNACFEHGRKNAIQGMELEQKGNEFSLFFVSVLPLQLHLLLVRLRVGQRIPHGGFPSRLRLLKDDGLAVSVQEWGGRGFLQMKFNEEFIHREELMGRGRGRAGRRMGNHGGWCMGR